MKFANRAIAIIASLLLGSSVAWANKLNFDGGFFSINATPPKNLNLDPISLSGFGNYSLSGAITVLPSVEIGAGYSVFFTKVLSGDMGFGPDFQANWYPFSYVGPWESKGPRVSYLEIDRYRPFLDLSFHQRQFQSAQSAFSGFGAGGGLERQWSEKISLRATFRMMNLLGPEGATFKATEVMFGLSQGF